MKIGNIYLDKTAALAPLAGVADRAFRELCRGYGASFTVGEMASAKGLMFSDKKTKELLALGEAERPGAVQLFGDEPEVLAEGAKLAVPYHPDWFDINMGCPAPKIAGGGGGSALMKNPTLAGEIVAAVVGAVDLPVTVKFRKGWDSNSVNAVEFAKICEANGASALTIHGRTREQMYAPSADWDIIAQVKNAVNIPVIGNGDVDSPESCAEMYRQTGCDLVMIGRGALGRPWLFSQIAQYMKTGAYSPDPSLEEKMTIMLKQASLACQYKGEYVAMREMRKHTGWYMKNMRGAADFRRRGSAVCTFHELELLAEELISAQQ